MMQKIVMEESEILKPEDICQKIVHGIWDTSPDMSLKNIETALKEEVFRGNSSLMNTTILSIIAQNCHHLIEVTAGKITQILTLGIRRAIWIRKQLQDTLLILLEGYLA